VAVGLGLLRDPVANVLSKAAEAEVRGGPLEASGSSRGICLGHNLGGRVARRGVWVVVNRQAMLCRSMGTGKGLAPHVLSVCDVRVSEVQCSRRSRQLNNQMSKLFATDVCDMQQQ
jgi:hypothetical protein